MRKNREVILDFTSLLDVIMLILFFFIIFAQLDASEAIKKVETMQAEAQQEKADADDKLEAANETLQQAEAQLKELQQANALAESIIINGAADFDKALRLKLVLDGKKENWSISVRFAEEKDGEIVHTEIGVISDVRNRNTDDIVKDFENIIIEYGYSKNAAFLCDLMYNSAGAGSKTAKDNTDEMLKIFQNDLGYKYLFTSTTDLSEIGGNENEKS